MSDDQDSSGFGEAYWDGRYSIADVIWSGQPNAALVDEVTTLPAGRALDVGCGEGADAVWLAQQGWAVTALELSEVALERARRGAEAAGVAVTFVRSGFLDAPLPPSGFDLVSAQYPALRRTPHNASERRLLSAVAPGGTLLVVHHYVEHPELMNDHGFRPADWVSPHDVAVLLDDDWRVDVDESRQHRVSGGAGAHHDRDVVLRATRVRGG